MAANATPESRMTAQALLDLASRRSVRRASARRGRPDGPAPITRNTLVTEFLAICELDSEVEALRAPAPSATFVVGRESIEHFADFEIIRDGEVHLIDVVAEPDLAKHPLFAATTDGAVATDGRPFRFETAARIRVEPRFTTVRLILACKRTPVTAGDRVRILHQLDESGTMRLVDCAGAAMNAVDGVAAVLALACEGLVAVDINQPIVPETPVRRRKVAYPDPFEF
jgi:hypothetical protein